MSDSLCQLFADWEPCEGCDKSGYDTGDCVQVCSNGQQYVAKSLVDDNTDEPFAGFVSSPRTWEVRSMCYWLSYVGVDCDGMTVSQGDAIATCSNLDELKTLLEFAIDKKQDQLVGSDGQPIEGGTCVPTCTEMDDAISTAIDNVPKPKNCAGEEVDQFVACDEFGELLEAALEECLSIPDIGSACGEVKKVASVVCADDPAKESLVSYTEAGIKIPRMAYGTDGDGSLSNVTPPNSFTYADYYSFNQLQEDFNAGAVDMDKLNSTRIFCADRTLPCDGSYNAYLEATVYVVGGTPEQRMGRFIMTMDGEFFSGGSADAVAGDPISPMSPFTNYVAEQQEGEWTFQATAGTHTFCLYLIGWTDAIPGVQVLTVGGAPLVDISRKV